MHDLRGIDALPEDRTGVCHRYADSFPVADAAQDRTTPGMTVFWHDHRPVGHVLRTPDGSITSRWAGKHDSERVAPAPVLNASPTLRASIVICTRDRPDAIRRCLESLRHQTLSPAEVIVVDNASVDDRTRQAALDAGVRYVREDRPGLDIARNTGAAAADGDLIVYTDDDVLLHPTWLERMVAAFDDPAVGAVTGLVLPAELASDAQFLFERYWSFGQGYDRRDFTPDDFAAYAGRQVFPAWSVGAGASMAFRREVFDRVGWFDERLDVGQAGCSGDSEYWYRLLAAGVHCRYEPGAVAFHVHRRDMAGLASQIRHYMRGHAAALLVQFERTGRTGNLWRALSWLPGWYLRRAPRAATGRGRPEDRFLLQEIRGWAGGILFYLKNRKPRHG